MRLQKTALALVLALTAFSVGCSWCIRSEYNLARKLQERGRNQSAAHLYESVLKRIPASDAHWRSEAHYRLGECLWSQGKVGEAFLNFQSAVDDDSDNLIARLRVGTILLAGGVPDRAGEEAAAVLRGSYGNIDALALLGAASSEAGQDLFAEAAYRQVLESDPGRVKVAIALADLLNRRDAAGEAREVLRKAAEKSGGALPLLALGRLEEQEGDSVAAEQAYRQAVAREDTPDVNLRLAQFLERSAQVAEAEKALERADQLRPRQPTALPDFKLLGEHTAGALERYTAALRSDRLDGAQTKQSPEAAASRAALAARIIEADLQQVPESSAPSHAISVARLHLDQFRGELSPAITAMLEAELALAAGDVTTAQSRASAAVELAPESAASHYVLGLVKSRAGDQNAARTAWFDAVQQDDDFVPARLALTRDLLRTGDVSAAEQYIVPAVREEPGNVRALCLYARVLLTQQRFGAATAIANRALAVNRKLSEPHVILGEIAFRQRNYAESFLQFERALLQNPMSPEAMDGLVRVYHRGEITPSALRNMERLAESKPQSATLMELAGRLYAEHGWHAGAERCFRRALAMEPGRLTASTALARILAARGKIHAATEIAGNTGGEAGLLVSAFRAQQRKQVAAAISRYEAALRAGEHSGVAANNLAWLYAEHNTNLDRALVLAEQACTLAPADPAVLDTLGVVHLRRREYSKAVEVLKGASLLASSTHSRQPQLAAEIGSHLAEARMHAGLPASAAR